MIRILFFLCIATTSLVGQSSTDTTAIMAHLDSLFGVSDSLSASGNVLEAFKIVDAAEVITLKHIGKVSGYYGDVCYFRAKAYLRKSDYSEAEKWYLAALEVQKEALGESHPYYASTLNSLGGLYVRSGKYDLAESRLLEAKQLKEKWEGTENGGYAIALINMGSFYQAISKYKEAEDYFLKSQKLFENTLGVYDLNYQIVLNNLGSLYQDIGRFDKAEVYLIKSKDIASIQSGLESPEYSTAVENLAKMYQAKGDYAQAEYYYDQAIIINKKVWGSSSPDYGLNLCNMAILLNQVGRLDEAIIMMQEGNQILGATLGKDHEWYCATRQNGIVFLSNQGDYAQVLKMQTELNAIWAKIAGKESVHYAKSQHILATYYKEMGQYDTSMQLYTEALSIREKLHGREHYNYAETLTEIAILLSAMGKYETAQEKFLEALAIQEKVYGSDHKTCAETQVLLAGLYAKMEKYPQAASLFTRAAEIDRTYILNGLSHLSEQEMNRYLATFTKRQERTLLFAQQTNGNTAITETCLDNSLFFKGFLLQAFNQNKYTALTDSMDIENYNQLKSYRYLLAREYTKPIPQRQNVSELEAMANELEKEMARANPEFGQLVEKVDWKAIQRVLNPGETLIDFVQYQNKNKEKEQTTHYAVLVLNAEDVSPHFIPLFEENELVSILNGSTTNKLDFINNLYEYEELELPDTTVQQGLVSLGKRKRSIYDVVWQKIERSGLDGVNRIYYSSTGILHRINMGAIPISDELILSDKYKFVSLNSPRQLAKISAKRTLYSGNEALVYGGIQFEADTTAITPLFESGYPLLATRSLAAIVEDSTLRGGTWQYLHWTQKEAEVISKTLSKGGLNAVHHSGLQATEESFKAMGQSNNPSPRVLHIATHGFFFPDPEQKTATSLDDQAVFKWSDNPMIRSGLILAGGNYAWQNGKPVSPDKEDGILTAYEISQMNLSNTELVVLSACETGLGDIQGNEGVYGLQRAFKIAGAKYLIMSLWQVPDRETMEFMTTFYKNWLPSDAEALAGKEEKMSIPDAFRKTQGEMRDRFDDVFSWGAFVLVE